jgi:hypothetical protein
MHSDIDGIIMGQSVAADVPAWTRGRGGNAAKTARVGGERANVAHFASVASA